MKKNLFFSMIVMLLCSIQVSAYTFYFHPNKWTYDKYAIESWAEDPEVKDYSEFMTPVAGHEGWFSTSVPDGNSNLYVCAYNSDVTDPATDDKGWSWQMGDGGTYTYF